MDEALIEHYAALRAIYQRACERYEALKGDGPALDFDDLEARAVGLLRDREDVRRYWQATIRALLVDEFQDTNARQRELLDLLNADRDRLFIVGDGKQSIYRFRGADVTVFRAVRSEIEGHGQAFDLATSYRAHRALIEAMNALLEPILGAGEDAARPYVEPFAPADPPSRRPGPRPAAALRRAAPGAGEQERRGDGAGGAGAGGPAGRTGRGDAGRRTSASFNYGDVAILCRATRSFPAYESALEEAGVPFLTVAGRGFYERPEVRDVLNALRALDDPTDDLALAGLLRSPACRLSDMALYRLREMQREGKLPSLWEALCARRSAGVALEERSRAVPPGLRADPGPARPDRPRPGGRRAQGLPGPHRLPRGAAARGPGARGAQRLQAAGRRADERDGQRGRVPGLRGPVARRGHARGRGAHRVRGRGADHERARGQGAGIPGRGHRRRGAPLAGHRGRVDRSRPGRAAPPARGAPGRGGRGPVDGGTARRGGLSPGPTVGARPGRGGSGPPAVRGHDAGAKRCC